MRSEQTEILAMVRSETGKKAARRLRAQGKIPAVIYGRGIKTLPIMVDEVAFIRSVKEPAWYSTLIKLNIDNPQSAERNPIVMVKEVQRDPIHHQILNIDFHRISLKEKIRAHIPIIHIGQSPGVKLGGILEHLHHEVLVECLPTDMPDHLEADISELQIGHSLRIRDLSVTPGVTLLAAPDDVILLVAPPVRAEAVATEEAAAAEEMAEPELIRERPQEKEEA